jgi:hypothetical protein
VLSLSCHDVGLVVPKASSPEALAFNKNGLCKAQLLVHVDELEKSYPIVLRTGPVDGLTITSNPAWGAGPIRVENGLETLLFNGTLISAVDILGYSTTIHPSDELVIRVSASPERKRGSMAAHGMNEVQGAVNSYEVLLPKNGKFETKGLVFSALSPDFNKKNCIRFKVCFELLKSRKSIFRSDEQVVELTPSKRVASVECEVVNVLLDNDVVPSGEDEGGFTKTGRKWTAEPDGLSTLSPQISCLAGVSAAIQLCVQDEAQIQCSQQDFRVEVDHHDITDALLDDKLYKDFDVISFPFKAPAHGEKTYTLKIVDCASSSSSSSSRSRSSSSTGGSRVILATSVRVKTLAGEALSYELVSESQLEIKNGMTLHEAGFKLQAVDASGNIVEDQDALSKLDPPTLRLHSKNDSDEEREDADNIPVFVDKENQPGRETKLRLHQSGCFSCSDCRISGTAGPKGAEFRLAVVGSLKCSTGTTAFRRELKGLIHQGRACRLALSKTSQALRQTIAENSPAYVRGLAVQLVDLGGNPAPMPAATGVVPIAQELVTLRAESSGSAPPSQIFDETIGIYTDVEGKLQRLSDAKITNRPPPSTNKKGRFSFDDFWLGGPAPKTNFRVVIEASPELESMLTVEAPADPGSKGKKTKKKKMSIPPLVIEGALAPCNMDIVESVSIDETALPSPWVAGANTNLRILASKVHGGPATATSGEFLVTSVTPKITYEKQDVPLVDSESTSIDCGAFQPAESSDPSVWALEAPLPTTMVLAGQYKIRILFEESRPQVTRFFPGGSLSIPYEKELYVCPAPAAALR